MSTRSLRAFLEARAARTIEATSDPIAHAPETPIALTRPHEISAMATGLLVVQMLEDTGRTRLQKRAIEDGIHRLTDHLHAAQMMRLEIEAYEIIEWLVGPNWSEKPDYFVASKQQDGTVLYDPSVTVPDLVREAIEQQFDIEITYYSSKRMELNRRVISPRAIAAEIYVRAWCHERKSDRIFRMERIRTATPVHGKPLQNPYLEHAISEEKSVQQSIEFQHLTFNMENIELYQPIISEETSADVPAEIPSDPPSRDDERAQSKAATTRPSQDSKKIEKPDETTETLSSQDSKKIEKPDETTATLPNQNSKKTKKAGDAGDDGDDSGQLQLL